MAADDGASAPQSQTLDRGLRILEHLAAVGTPQPIADIGQAVGLHRSITYRLLRTLEDHQLVERDPAGHYRLGLGVVGLARGVRTDLQSAALPRLDALVAHLGMTAFLVVRAGDEAVTVSSVEPHDSPAHVVYRPGIRHPVGQGAPGLALLMPEAATPEDREALREARRLGWATSRGEVIPGLRSVAAPVLGPDGGTRAALAVVYVDDAADTTQIGQLVAAASREVSTAIR
ncbi:transcriptional regulator, IclR family [Geodermatophilus africanus]|uniref:Transcriptional regulator, IclR family n=1 Tax=Geodermatophilus africanus TaxID=1137993 RepID=A0A1H3DGU6_9ACTN|nr:IclR family transcriptional regulator [Geodermatophilus africanus]SDX65560.1 transcriptional regulator, IclR family [Geodermatophilus africanus]